MVEPQGEDGDTEGGVLEGCSLIIQRFARLASRLHRKVLQFQLDVQ